MQYKVQSGQAWPGPGIVCLTGGAVSGQGRGDAGQDTTEEGGEVVAGLPSGKAGQQSDSTKYSAKHNANHNTKCSAKHTAKHSAKHSTK